MMIKSWHKYNESSQELTEDMILNLIYFRNCSVFSDKSVESINKDIDSLIDIYLETELEFESEEMSFINKEEYKIVMGYIHQIYQLASKDPKLKTMLMSLYERVKKSMGKILFTDYEDLFLEYMDDDYELSFVFKPSDCMKIELKKLTHVEEHINCLQRANSTIKRLCKVFSIPESIVFISSASFEAEYNGYNSSNIEITVL